jgi:PAS domain S-box-containing protein
MPVETSASKKLNHCKEKIIAEWESRVRQNTPPSRRFDRTQLRNSLPEVLNVMVEILCDPASGSAVFFQEKGLAVNHGRIRAQESDYSLVQVINEYRTLQKVLFEVLEEDGQNVTSIERDLILDIITISIRESASEFKAFQDREKADLQKNLDQTNIALRSALEKKSSEVGLKDQLLKTIFERVEDYALFSLDQEGKITSWSDGCLKMKQYSAEEIIGTHYSILFPPEGRIRGEPQKHLEIAHTQGRFRGEGLRQRKNGDLYLADVFISPMYENSILVGFFKIVADMTERNKLIQEMDLTRTQVKGMKLERELRERFVNMLSHDLRSPLTAAQMSLELIARESCSVDRHHELAQRGARHIERMDEMVTNLLDASRITEGEPFPLKITQFDLVKVVTEACDDLATMMGDRFKIIAPASLIGFWDANGLKRVIENLAMNAVKYGDVQADVTISLRELENRVIITVHNFGLPITSKDQESLFDLFRRADSAQHGANKGWGLGLTLVRGISEAHGGIVKVRSLPGEGTTFIIDLPRASAKFARRMHDVHN